MKLYVNCITSGAELRNDIKVLIPEMNLRRRMGRLVKSGVAAGIESLLAFGDRAPIDAVITATGLGCIADSEKFLEGLIANQEAMLNPTPFIQSTFNTVGAQIALLRGLHCYNTTYAHRWASFENALTDAALRLGAGLSRAVLVGAFDETTPTVERVLQRLGAIHQGGWGESSVFFVLTAEAFDTTVAAITGIRFAEGTGAGASREFAVSTPADRFAVNNPADREFAVSTPTGREPAARNNLSATDGGVQQIRATQTGVVPHFTAIAEAFRRVVTENTGHAPDAGHAVSTGCSGDIENTGEAESTENTVNTGEAGNNRNAGEAGSTENTGNTGKTGNAGNNQNNQSAGEAGSTENTGNTGNTVATGNNGNDRNKEIAGRRIMLYNDFPGEVISAIELTCM